MMIATSANSTGGEKKSELKRREVRRAHINWALLRTGFVRLSLSLSLSKIQRALQDESTFVVVKHLVVRKQQNKGDLDRSCSILFQKQTRMSQLTSVVTVTCVDRASAHHFKLKTEDYPKCQ